MNVTMEIERPDDVKITLTCTMTLAQWDVLRESLTKGLNSGYSWDDDVAAFRNCIGNARDQVRGKVTGGPLISET